MARHALSSFAFRLMVHTELSRRAATAGGLATHMGKIKASVLSSTNDRHLRVYGGLMPAYCRQAGGARLEERSYALQRGARKGPRCVTLR